MRKTIIRLISLLLLFSMLLPLAVACADDPPPNENNPGEEETEMNKDFFNLKVKNTTDYKIVDLENATFVDSNTSIQNNLLEKDGKKVIKYDCTSKLQANLTETYCLLYATSIRFSVYSENASEITVEVGFPYADKPEKTGDASSEKILIDFVGWKDFEIIPNKMTGTGMGDKMAVSFYIEAQKNANGSIPEDTLYFTGVTVTKAEYEVIAPEGVNVNDATLYTAITDRARELYLGSPDILDTNEYKNSLDSVITSCQQRLEEYKAYKQTHPTHADDEIDKIFTDNSTSALIDTKDHVTWNKGEAAIATYYEAILALAKGYGMQSAPDKTNPYYCNEEVLEAIIYCLDYGYEYYYGQKAVDGGAYANWWWWKIGIAQQLIPILLIIEDKITPELCDHYLTCFDHHVPYPEANAGNKIWLARLSLISAALRRNAHDICVDTLKMNDLFDYIDSYISEGGFFRDGSFIQHGSFAYTGGYGATYMNDLPQILYMLTGTRFYPQQKNISNIYTWIIDSFRPIMFDNIKMSSLSGRNVGRGNQEDARAYVGCLIFIHLFAPDSVKGELENIIAHFMQRNNTSFSDNAPLLAINHAKELYTKLKDVQLEDYEVAKVYGMMSRVIQHTPKYAVCLALSSKSIAKYESISDENRTGWYQGDGAIFIYTNNLLTGNAYSFDHRFYWYANPYLVPGTTVNSAERNLSSTHGANLFNSSDYAGGATLGKYASIGYEHGYTTASKSFKNENDKKITAKKSYFMFDNEIICVGSDIKDASGTPVKTVVENRIWEDGDILTEIDSRALHFTNFGGYVYLYPQDGVEFITNKATGEWHSTQKDKPASADGSADFLEITLEHGKGNSSLDGKYMYAYLPEASADETTAYMKNPDVILLRRDQKAHAVLEKTLGIVAANFFGNTTVGVSDNSIAVTKVTALTRCSVMIAANEDGSYTISVADPTRALSDMDFTVNISGITQVVSADSGITASVNNGVVTVKVNCKDSLGQTFTLTVK